MPAANVVLLPLCITLMLLALIGAGISVRRRKPGRVAQWLGLAMVPLGLYLTGLLRLVWNGVVAVVGWAVSVVLSPLIWLGLGLLGLAVVLLLVGGLLRRRDRGRGKQPVPARTRAQAVPARAGSRPTVRTTTPSAAPDDDMAEIEALLKSRGIS